MVNWQVTATTIHCPAVDDEVTIMVFKDATVKCTGDKKYRQPSREAARSLKAREQQAKRELKCPGLDCPQATAYRDKLFAEETGGGATK